MTSYVILLVLALLFNIGNPRVLALTVIVGAGIFVPIPAPHFYAWCAAVELLVLFLAMLVGSGQGHAVALLCVALLLCHLMGFLMDGYTSRAYFYLVRIYEHAELLICMLGSRIRRM